MRHDLVQGSQEWLDFRKGKIGASQVSIIMGVSPYQTRHQLWSEMVGLTQPREATFAMQRGSRLEKKARGYLEVLLDESLEPDVFSHDEMPWLICSLDGISEDGSIITEIKCLNDRSHQEAKMGIIPEHYKPQMQMQMFITGVEECHYFSYTCAEEDGEIIRQDGVDIIYKRDDKYIEKMIKECNKFYDLVLSYTPPELVERDFLLRQEPEWLEAGSAWVKAQQKLKEAAEEEDKLRQKLILLADNQNSYGAGIKLIKYVAKGTVDYKAIPELERVDLDQFRKAPSERWRLCVA